MANGIQTVSQESTKNEVIFQDSILAEIKKRDGRVVTFDPEKITAAVKKAFKASKEGDDDIANAVTAAVCQKLSLEKQNALDFVPDVEKVQDLVEEELILRNFVTTAKNYILYRQRHAEIRAQKTEELLSAKAFQVVKRDGSKQVFNELTLKKYLLENLKGYKKDIPTAKFVDEIVNEVKANLFEGITTSEVNDLAVFSARARIEKDIPYTYVAARLLLNGLYKEILAKNDFQKGFATAYKNTFASKISHGVKVGRYDTRLADFDLKKLALALKPQRDNLLNYLGIETLVSRYFVTDYTDKILELPQYFWMRVAMGLAILEKNKEEKAIEFYDLLSQLFYIPSTPTLFQAGTIYPQLSSCFLNTVYDDLHHIFKVYSDNAQLSKFSGGIGTDWSYIRATGALIKTTNVSSQGVIPFLKIADSTTAAINRSGRRRGAAVAYLETWHYDIESFLELRKNTGDDRRRTHDMNTANWIPDLFMKRVLGNKTWTLFSPDETPDLHDLYGKEFEERYEFYEKLADKGKIKLFKRMPATELWRKMLTQLYETGHPWMVYKDPCNIRSPQDHVGVVHSSNLCTEITLNTSDEETAVCNLGSVNLVRHVVNGRLNQKLLKSTINIAMRMLDNVIDINFYPTKEARQGSLRHRPVGLGLMGFTDLLFEMDMSFDSDRAVEVSDRVQEMVSYFAISASSDLAHERGAYESFKGSKWDRGIFPLDTVALVEKERGLTTGVTKQARMDWKKLKAKVKKYGMRNSNCMAIAPTSNLANVAGCVAFSIEPVYKNLFVKSNVAGEFTVLNTYLIAELKKLGLWDQTMLDRIKSSDGSIQDIVEIPQKLRDRYKESFDIHPFWVIKHAAYRGKWIDQSQSVNIFTNTVSGKDLSDIYETAWMMGLKATYYLRTLGATSIEKSTVTIDSQNRIPANSETNSDSKPFADLKSEADQSEGLKAVACLLDEGCEACQ